MTSATERLRALLDERCVEYTTDDGEYLKETCWAGELMATFVELENGETRFELKHLHFTPEQAVAATLGVKVKSHPYGYEPDTGAFDATRCECGCINDISATYCNDCGGEIEIDVNAEKEIYHTPAHMVFAEKHDDGSLEFAGKRYVAATLGTIDKGAPQGADGNLDQAQVDWLRLMPDGWDGTAPATLGSGTLTAEQVRETVEKHWHDLSADYDMPEATALPEYSYDWQAIADELNATLGVS